MAKSLTKSEYISRINRVVDYVDAHLYEELTVEQLAAVAQFSSFHFHRIFTATVGESLYKFIQRLRLERAAIRLIVKPDEPVTNVALECGFSGSSAFARAFKEHYGVSASVWRDQHSSTNSKIGITMSKNGQEVMPRSEYGLHHIQSNEENIMGSSSTQNATSQSLPMDVQVIDLPETTVAYVRHIGHFKDSPDLFRNLFFKIINWAGARDLLNFPETKVLSMYHDNPDITDEENQRVSLCVTVPADTKVDGDIGKMVIKGGKYAVAHFELKTPEEFKAAWRNLYGQWLPQSGYQPDDSPPFEVYLNNPEEHPERLEIIDICLAVKPL